MIDYLLGEDDIYNTGDGITGLDAAYIQQLEATKS